MTAQRDAHTLPGLVFRCTLRECLEGYRPWLERDQPTGVSGLTKFPPVLPCVGPNIHHTRDFGAAYQFRSTKGIEVPGSVSEDIAARRFLNETMGSMCRASLRLFAI